MCEGDFRGLRIVMEILTPDVGGVGFVASGLGLTMGASEG